MRILVTERQLKILEQNKTPQEQLDDFNNQEDKIKSSFIPKKVVKKWLTYLETKYPSLLFRFEYGNDVLIAKGKMKNITESDDMDSPLGKRVMVHYNLHKHTFSVTHKNLVILHADYVKLSDVEFRVRPGGKDRVRQEKSKNVHAFVIGNLVDYCEFPCNNLPEDSLGNVVTYNPYKYDSFVYKDTEEPIYHAKEVDMINLKNKLFVINEITQR
jgi:hypothetical protein